MEIRGGSFQIKRLHELWACFLRVGGVSTAVIALSIAAILSGGFPDRLNQAAAQLASAAQEEDPLSMGCQGTHDLFDPACRFGSPEAELSFIVVGDSPAGSIRQAIKNCADSAGRAGTILRRRSCQMIIGATRVPDARSRECSAFKDDALQAILSSDSMDTVSVAGRWEAAYSGVLPEADGSY